MSLQEVIRHVTSRAEAVRVRNAFNPILWGCAVASPTCFLSAFLFASDPILRYALVALGSLPVLTLTTAHLYFMLRDPGRLQSEEFVPRQQQLTITERKGMPPLSVDPVIPDELTTPAADHKERR